MGRGFTTAFLINTGKLIKIWTQYVRENWTEKKLTVHKEYGHSNTEWLILRQCICKRNSCNMKVKNGNCMGNEGAVESKQNLKQTLSVKFSPALNRCHIRSCERVCLTTTPAAWPTNVTISSSLGASVGITAQSHFPLCAKKTQFETQLVSHVNTLLLVLYLIFQTGNLLLCNFTAFLFQTKTSHQHLCPAKGTKALDKPSQGMSL